MLLLGVDEGVDMAIECVGGLPHVVLGAFLAGYIGPVHQTKGLALPLQWTG